MKRSNSRKGADKRHLTGRAGRWAVKGPMDRQHLDGYGNDLASRTKGRMHWEAKAQ